MASRENQGLQISLILLVMLVVGLGIVAGVFYNANASAQEQARADSQKAQQANSEKTQAITERNELKRMIGHTDETTMEEVRTQFESDLKSFTDDENGPDPTMSYRKIPVELRNKYSTLEQQLARAREQVVAITAERDAAQAEKDASVAKAVAAKDAAEKKSRDLTAEYANFRASMEASQQKVLDDKTAIQGNIATVKAEAAQQVSAVNEELADKQKLLDGIRKINEDLKPQVGDKPDGKVVWSNQREQTVWVNLGSADMLRPQMTFSIYPVGENNLVDTDPKATIEITRIHSRHQAEARITKSEVANPVMPGDSIFTPVWTPGRSEKFAIVGFIDLDDDDKDDTQQLREIIETAGGEVAVYVDGQGKIQGSLTPEIRYLILGDRPTDKTSEGGLQAYTTMSETARDNGIDAIRVDQFIDWAGYVGAEELVRLNASSKLEEMKVAEEKEAAGFQKRRPNGNSAF